MPALAFIFVNYKAKRRNLKTEVTRKQSTPNFPKSEHSLPPDIHTYAHLRSEIRFFAFLTKKREPPSIESPTPQIFLLSAPHPLPICVFFMFVKSQLNQSENKIYRHNSSITLLTFPMSFILLIH